MKDKQEYTELVCSKMTGHNLYYFSKIFDPVHDVTTTAEYLEDRSPVSVKGGQESFSLDWYRKMILNPVLHPAFEWPQDIVMFSVPNGKAFLIFEYKDCSRLHPLREILTHRDVGFGVNENTIRLCKNILRAFSYMDKVGYAYHNFDVDTMMFNPDTMAVFFPFNQYIRAKTLEKNTEHTYDWIPCEKLAKYFAPPYIFYPEYDGYLSEQVDYYQIAALMFRLLIGKLPYDGSYVRSNVEGFVLNSHYSDAPHYFDVYLRCPKFIFDPDDEGNRLPNAFDENETYTEKWRSLSSVMRDKFIEVLCQKTAEGRNPDPLPTPQDWLDIIEEWSPSKKTLK